MKMSLGIIVTLIIGLYLFSKWKVTGATSAGNPNQPPVQGALTLGPQGPNDGSNNYSGSGHTILPLGDRNPVSYPIYSRGFSYGASRVPNVY